MRSRVILIVLAVLLSIALLQVLRLRFESNDLLPEYSSLRNDPKGLNVLFDALGDTGAVPVSRSNRPLALLKSADATLVIAGVDRYSWLDAESTIGDIEALARRGNRVVVALGRALNRFEKDLPKEPLLEKWGVRVFALPPRDAARWPAYFLAGSDWHILQAMKGHAWMIERKFGSGSVVLLASSWPLTNQAMVEDRRSELLSSLFSAKPQVIFDESHLGLEENGNVMALSRTFHLQGFLMGLVVLACLYIWRNLAGFPPDRALPLRRTGRDSLSGLSILLARHVPEKNLIDTCLAERRLPKASVPAGNTVERFEAIRQGLHRL